MRYTKENKKVFFSCKKKVSLPFMQLMRLIVITNDLKAFPVCIIILFIVWKWAAHYANLGTVGGGGVWY
jgi:hypothetical protein